MKFRGALFIGLLLLPLFGCSNSSGPSNTPVISNVNITPNPVAFGKTVQIAVTYVSPDNSPATTVFIQDIGMDNATPLPIAGRCGNCTVYFDVDTRLLGRGAFGGELWIIDSNGRRSNTLTFVFTVT